MARAVPARVFLLPVVVLCARVLHTFDDVVWHVSWSVSGNILAVSGGDNKVTGPNRSWEFLPINIVISTARYCYFPSLRN